MGFINHEIEVRKNRSLGGKMYYWDVIVPGSDGFCVEARTKSEARVEAKDVLDLNRKERLPLGTIVKISCNVK